MPGVISTFRDGDYSNVVDKRIGDAYLVVKDVQENLPAIITLSEGFAAFDANAAAAIAAKDAADADVVLTNADVVLTHADVVTTTAQAVIAADNAALTAADRVQTGVDAASIIVATKKFNTYAEQMAYVGAYVDGQKADVLGYYAIGDGGGNSFYWDSTSTATENNGTIIKPTNVSGAGRWLAVNKSVVELTQFGADRTGAASAVTAIQAAFDYANTNSYQVIDTVGGTYSIDSTVNVYGVGFEGAGSDKTKFMSTITNGSPMFQTTTGAGVQFVKWRKCFLTSAVNPATFLAGGSAQNCIGLKLGNASYYCNRFLLDDVRIYGLKQAAYSRGYIGTGSNVFIEYCELGWEGIENNGCSLNFRFENNRQDFKFTSSDGLHLPNLLVEGGNTVTVSSLLDGCKGVDIPAIYTEYGIATPRSTPYITIGATTECKNVKITGSVTGYTTLGTYGIAVDKCDGLDIDAAFSLSDRNTSVSTTINTKNYKLNGSIRLASRLLQDASLQLGTALNYWPNRNFETWLRGYNDVIPSAAVGTQETTTVRKGNNAYRVTANAAATNANVGFKITGNLPIYLRGHTMKLGAWVYIPAIPHYDESLAVGSRALPNIVFASYNGTTLITTAAKNDGFKSGAWNFVESYNLQVQSDATQLFVYCYANNSAFVCDGSEYIIVDSIVLTEYSTPYYRMLNDSLIDSPQCPMTAVGGKVTLSQAAIPTDADQHFEVGDEVRFTAPVSAGYVGAVCTVAGSPGTWKNYGLIT